MWLCAASIAVEGRASGSSDHFSKRVLRLHCSAQGAFITYSLRITRYSLRFVFSGQRIEPLFVFDA